ncbi:MAG: hypothetical protein CMH83_00030 [Nocardioides sp.]|nr:hypothetical protein [Nocardioides sp.]
MTGLLRVELSRLRSRRAVAVLVLMATLVLGVIAFGVTVNTDRVSDADIARAEKQAARDGERRDYRRSLAQCVREPESWGVAADTEPAQVRADCEDAVLPRVEWYLDANVLDLDEEREFGSGIAVAAFTTVLLFLLGATFAGHDWSTGSMSNQLLFESRRVRVWSVKALAVVIGAAVVGVVLLSAYWLYLAGVVASRGQPLDGAVLLDCLQMGWRSAAFAAAAALGGYVLTMLSRSTVFSLGVVIASFVGGGLLVVLFGVEVGESLNPVTNAAAVLYDGATYYVEPPRQCGFPGAPGDLDCTTERLRTFTQGFLYYLSVVGVVGAASLLSFRRRDVP